VVALLSLNDPEKVVNARLSGKTLPCFSQLVSRGGKVTMLDELLNTLKLFSGWIGCRRSELQEHKKARAACNPNEESTIFAHRICPASYLIHPAPEGHQVQEFSLAARFVGA
jgi:hypothetical protein